MYSARLERSFNDHSPACPLPSKRTLQRKLASCGRTLSWTLHAQEPATDPQGSKTFLVEHSMLGGWGPSCLLQASLGRGGGCTVVVPGGGERADIPPCQGDGNKLECLGTTRRSNATVCRNNVCTFNLSLPYCSFAHTHSTILTFD